MFSIIADCFLYIGYGFFLYIGVSILQEIAKAVMPSTYNAISKRLQRAPKAQPMGRWDAYKARHIERI